LDTDFELNDRFCDANDLKTSWNNVNIPEPLLKFSEALYRFDATSSCSSSGDAYWVQLHQICTKLRTVRM